MQKIHNLGTHEMGNVKGKVKLLGRELGKEFKILCLDEFQVIDIADAMIIKCLLSEMIMKNGIRIFLTSNRKPEDLYDMGIQRDSFLPCIELIKKEFIVLDLSGQDYRMFNRTFTRKFFQEKEEFVKHMETLSTKCTILLIDNRGRRSSFCLWKVISYRKMLWKYMLAKV